MQLLRLLPGSYQLLFEMFSVAVSGPWRPSRGTDEYAAKRCRPHLERQMETALLQARTFDTLALADSPARLTGG